MNSRPSRSFAGKYPAHRISTDNTAYARCIGYTGKRRVLVLDGRVTSHHNQCWFEFCERTLRRFQIRTGHHCPLCDEQIKVFQQAQPARPAG